MQRRETIFHIPKYLRYIQMIHKKKYFPSLATRCFGGGWLCTKSWTATWLNVSSRRIFDVHPVENFLLQFQYFPLLLVFVNGYCSINRRSPFSVFTRKKKTSANTSNVDTFSAFQSTKMRVTENHERSFHERRANERNEGYMKWSEGHLKRNESPRKERRGHKKNEKRMQNRWKKYLHCPQQLYH